MKIRVFKVFGYEVLRIESHYEATISDVVRAIIENSHDDEAEYVCECCCEDDEESEEDDEEFRVRFADMTERIVWDARSQDIPQFPQPEDEDEDK